MKITTLQTILGTFLRLTLAITFFIFIGCASTKISVPVMQADGRSKSVSILSTQADARNVQFAYQGAYGTITFSGEELNHSEPTRAGAETIRASGTAASSTIASYFAGQSLLEGVKGNNAKNLDKGKTTRHGESQKTTRHINDNSTKVNLAEIEAAP